ncbi:MAG: glycoside hydrolase family 32 protein [Lachnospiraceae bacterium]|nr:glycoside hydrolase family 32 protein [Lachnospiraceae bacterium]
MQRDMIHLKAPKGWINDPNGFIYYKGNYHLFYQHFPYAPRWATMHWGHAISEDLVHWEHLDVALFPTKYEDQNGCFSGSAIEEEGRLHLFYTGVHYDKTDPENIHMCLDDAFSSAQLGITSEDGFHFDNFDGKKVIIPAISDEKTGHRTHTRDPKVWRGRDAWYLVLGSSTKDKKGELIFYKSTDLSDWELLSTASTEQPMGWMWECPDYFAVDGGEVLVISPMGVPVEGTKEQNHSICMPVTFEEETGKLQLSECYQYLDYGLDLYAPQSTVDAQGRRVLVAWLRMPMPFAEGRIGMFCIPRLVEVKDGHIYFRVHPNVEQMYQRQITDIVQADPAGYRVSMDLDDGGCVNIGGYRIRREGSRICTDREDVFPACENRENFQMQSSTPELKDGFHLDVYVERNLIEVFVNQGEYVISQGVYGLKWELEADPHTEVELYTLPEA